MRAIIILGGGILKVELIHHPEEGMRGRWVTVRGKHVMMMSVLSREAPRRLSGKVPFELTPKES